jgi:hypothetical protein
VHLDTTQWFAAAGVSGKIMLLVAEEEITCAQVNNRLGTSVLVLAVWDKHYTR